MTFTGIPYFAPELFKKIVIKNPLKTKQLHKGLQQLSEEGAIQVFRPLSGVEIILGAVGQLQFEVAISRLQEEYGVDAFFEPCGIYSARWVDSDKKSDLDQFIKAVSAQLSYDTAQKLAYLAPNQVNLDLTQERWPNIHFYTTREHAIS